MHFTNILRILPVDSFEMNLASLDFGVWEFHFPTFQFFEEDKNLMRKTLLFFSIMAMKFMQLRQPQLLQTVQPRVQPQQPQV